MEKETKFMDLNRETAMRLWSKTFGKETKVKDYAGRLISKGAYNDRQSDFGWNVDHILPQSKGGVTAEHNLVICHIETNDEKADKFPCFTANKKKFEIIKVENHYEIKCLSSKGNKKSEIINEDFLDSAYGLKVIRKLDEQIKRSRFVGVVLIRLSNLKTNSVIDFIEQLFKEENIHISKRDSGDEVDIFVRNSNVIFQGEISDMLDKCVTLNTYLQGYFLSKNYLSSYEMFYIVKGFHQDNDFNINLYSNDLKDFKIQDNLIFTPSKIQLRNCLYINDLARVNTEARNKVEFTNSEFYEYDYVFTKLSKDLEKEVYGK